MATKRKLERGNWRRRCKNCSSCCCCCCISSHLQQLLMRTPKGRKMGGDGRKGGGGGREYCCVCVACFSAIYLCLLRCLPGSPKWWHEKLCCLLSGAAASALPTQLRLLLWFLLPASSLPTPLPPPPKANALRIYSFLNRKKFDACLRRSAMPKAKRTEWKRMSDKCVRRRSGSTKQKQ